MAVDAAKGAGASVGTRRGLAVWKALLLPWMLVMIWAGFWWAPQVRGLDDETYVMYFHIPMAWIGGLAYFVAAFYAIKYLAKRDLRSDAVSAASAEIGLLFTALSTFTGALWARSQWGAYWNWDPKQTSIFLLLLTYGAYFMLRVAVEDPDRRATLCAAYALLAAVAVPFLMVVVPKFVVPSTLHPAPVVDRVIDRRIGMVLGGFNLGFTGIYVWMLQLKTRLLAVEAEREVVL